MHLISKSKYGFFAFFYCTTILSSPAFATCQADDAGCIEPIIITAQRRNEQLQDVPASIAAITAAAIEARGLADTREILSSIPSLNLTANRGVASDMKITMRGVGTIVDDVDEPVAVYLDDVLLASAGMFNVSVVDIERVEVLRGPQGTLYGRNAMAGAINIISKTPRDHLEASAEATIGNYDYMQLKAMANVPLADGLMMRANVAYTRRDGIVSNRTTGDDMGDLDNFASRLQLRAFVGDDLTIDIAADYSRDNVMPGVVGPVTLARDLETNIFEPYREKKRTYGGSLKLTQTADAFTLMSITGLRYLDDRYAGSEFVPIDSSRKGASTDQRQISQELRFVSAGDGPLDWAAGAFYFNERRRLINFYEVHQPLVDLFGGAFPLGYTESSNALLKTESWALFGDMTYELSPGLSISAGARYGMEDKSIDYLFAGSVDLGFGVFAHPQNFYVKDDFRAFQPKFTVSYEIGSGGLVYGTISRGYKSGGFNNVFLAPPLDANGNVITDPTSEELLKNYRYRPEKMWNYEAGFKLEPVPGQLTVNGAVFLMDWSGQQVLSTDGVIARIGNARRSRSIGMELDVVAAPASGLEINAGIGFNNATFRSAEGIQDPINATIVRDVSGNRQPYSPKWTGTVSATYTTEISDTLSLPIGFDVSLRSSQYFDIFNQAEIRQNSYALLNARVGLETENWSITAFIKNLTDRRYLVSGRQCGVCRFFPPAETFVGAGGEPRTYGITARAKF